MRRFLHTGWAIFLALALAIGACRPAVTPTPAPTPLTVKDDLGREVAIPSIPQRILSLAPSHTEVLFSLGLGSRVVGTDDFSDFPAEAQALPKVGSPFPGFNLEKIVELEPDLVLAIPGTYIDSLQAQGLRVVVLEPKNLDGMLERIELIGKITGTLSRAQQITSDMKARIEAIKARSAGKDRPRVFFEVDATEPTRPWTAGPGSFIDSLISLAGGENIASAGPQAWFQISTEELIHLNPQVIILGDAEFGVTPEMVAQRPGWSGMEAVRLGRVYSIDTDLVSRPGPRLVQGLEELARLIHPEL